MRCMHTRARVREWLHAGMLLVRGFACVGGMHACSYVGMHACMCVHMLGCMRARVFACMCVHMLGARIHLRRRMHTCDIEDVCTHAMYARMRHAHRTHVQQHAPLRMQTDDCTHASTPNCERSPSHTHTHTYSPSPAPFPSPPPLTSPMRMQQTPSNDPSHSKLQPTVARPPSWCASFPPSFPLPPPPLPPPPPPPPPPPTPPPPPP